MLISFSNAVSETWSIFAKQIEAAWWWFKSNRDFRVDHADFTAVVVAGAMWLERSPEVKEADMVVFGGAVLR